VVHPLVSNEIFAFDALIWAIFFSIGWLSESKPKLNLMDQHGVGKEPSWAIHQQQKERERRGPLSLDSCHKWLAFFVLFCFATTP